MPKPSSKPPKNWERRCAAWISAKSTKKIYCKRAVGSGIANARLSWRRHLAGGFRICKRAKNCRDNKAPARRRRHGTCPDFESQLSTLMEKAVKVGILAVQGDYEAHAA